MEHTEFAPATEINGLETSTPVNFLSDSARQDYEEGSSINSLKFSPSESNKEGLPSLEIIKESPAEANQETMSQRTNEAMRDFFFTGDLPVVSLQDKERKSASAWDMGQAMQANLSTVEHSSDESNEHERALSQDVTILDTYWDRASNPPGYDSHSGPEGHKYYDDNAWIGISLMDGYERFGESADLERAKEVFDFLEFGANETGSLSKPGGVLWSQEPENLYRGAVSTGGATQLALMLYGETKDEKYLQFAEKQYDWMNQNLRSPDGLYFDGMDADGKVHEQQYTYNQGLMIGNATLLYQTTGDTKYLDQAQEIAKESLETFKPGAQKAGIESFNEQLPFFNAAFFKNLMALDAVAPSPEYREALADYSKYLGDKVDNGTGVITIKGEQTLLHQASAVQIFALAEKYPPSNK